MRPRFTVTEHEAVAAELRAMQRQLQEIESRIFAAFPKQSEAAKRATAADEALFKLRCELEREAESVMGAEAVNTAYFG